MIIYEEDASILDVITQSFAVSGGGMCSVSMSSTLLSMLKQGCGPSIIKHYSQK